MAGDPHRERLTAIVVLAEVALARGEVERAEKLLWEAERLLAEGGDWSDNANAHTALAQCALARGKPAVALEHLRTSYALCRQAGPSAMDTLFLLETLSVFVRAHLDGGEPDAAVERLRELTELDARFGEELGRAYQSRAEGWVQTYRGETAAAIASLQRSAVLWKRIGWQYEWAQTLRSVAAVCATAGDARRAADLADQATEFLSKVGARSEPLAHAG